MEGTPFFACQLLDSFQSYSRSKSKVVGNRAKFGTFLAPYFFGVPPKFWDLYSDHTTKFHGDRPRQLGGLALKTRNKEEDISSKT